ncbi:MAG: cyclase family protein, partial [Deltaproteobacteria bacterium]|nr:cyclase family protein [Deltaproteobacteria bacterium]
GLTVDQVPLYTLIGPAHVVEMPDGRAVTAGFLESRDLPPRVERVLFKTRNGALWEVPRFQRRFVYVDESAAHWLLARGARLVGIDYLSAEQYGARRAATHLALLGAGAVILEGIDLRHVPPGEYTLVCLPLRLEGGDGAPARAVLLKGWEGA